jgi:hypothetical protein
MCLPSSSLSCLSSSLPSSTSTTFHYLPFYSLIYLNLHLHLLKQLPYHVHRRCPIHRPPHHFPLHVHLSLLLLFCSLIHLHLPMQPPPITQPLSLYLSLLMFPPLRLHLHLHLRLYLPLSAQPSPLSFKLLLQLFPLLR